MRDSEEKANCAIAAIALLDEYRIPFSCSMVGMPNITGTDDMRQTIRDIAHYGADSIQIFMPGFSSHIKRIFFQIRIISMPSSKRSLMKLRLKPSARFF
ncbi:MAG: hypothetical protein ACLR5Q_08015 [Coprococcus sp.]